MKKIIYYVATSIDGFIAGINDDVSLFYHEGEGVQDYFNDIKTYKTVLMGRKTYEIGYNYGLEPGQPAYAHMENFVFSDHMKLDTKSPLLHLEKMNIDKIKQIKKESPTDIYLCGGGKFAQWLLDHNCIDQIKLKINPIILGNGTKLFGELVNGKKLNLIDHKVYEDGMIISTYDL